MNKNIDLTKILKDCPKWWKFWSPIFGEVEFTLNAKELGFINVAIDNGDIWSFNADATISIGNVKSTEIMLYPSKDQRDWSKFTAPWYKKEKFDPKTLKAFDKVLVRDNNNTDNWRCDFFSHIEKYDIYKYVSISGGFKYCIPYNDETKHLVGTTKEAPEFYRYWED